MYVYVRCTHVCRYVCCVYITGITVVEEDIEAIFDSSSGTSLSVHTTDISHDEPLSKHDLMLLKTKGLYSQASSL
jgi:hypothetical protein